MNGNDKAASAAVDEGVEVEVGTLSDALKGSTALEAVDRAAIDVQIATAKRYPRSVDKSLKEALTLATLDQETAGSMFYALPRSGKTIEGPSARLAEVMAYTWGNLRADADVVAEDRTHVTAMGTCFDLEKNVAIRVRVKRRITDKRGNRFNEDMIGVTSNAAISIALRNSVFKVIPAALVQKVYREARMASVGKAGTMEQKRQNAVAWFEKLGVQEAEVFAVLGVNGMDDIGEDQLITLRGLRNALQDGETTVTEVFRPSGHSEGTDELNDALKGAGGHAGDEPPEEEDDGSPATKSQIEQLKKLRQDCRAADAIDGDLEQQCEDALKAKDGPIVRLCIRELSKALIVVQDGGQGGLGLEG